MFLRKYSLIDSNSNKLNSHQVASIYYLQKHREKKREKEIDRNVVMRMPNENIVNAFEW